MICNKTVYYFSINDKKGEQIGYGYTTKKYFDKILFKILSSGWKLEITETAKLYCDHYNLTFY